MASRSFPRVTYALVAVLIAASVALWALSSRRSDPSLTLGGPLFPSDLQIQDVEGFLLSKAGTSYRFDRGDDGVWRLSGALTDFVDAAAVHSLLSDLLKAQSGGFLPGTEVEDRRYDFNGPESLRLTLYAEDGLQYRLALGVSNPVTGTYYASGLGRPGCFPVTEVLRQRLAKIPDSIRLKTLLPYFDRRIVEKVTVDFGEQDVLLERRGERWWLREPEAGLSLPKILTAYNDFYEDRREEREGRVWLLAGKDVIWQLIYECSEVTLSRFLHGAEIPGGLVNGDSEEIWRRVMLEGPSINPDSTEADPNRLEIIFGTPLENGQTEAMRRGHPLQATAESVNLLRGATTDLLESSAFTFEVSREDTLRMDREGTLLLAGHRESATPPKAGTQQRPANEFWQTDYPTAEMNPNMRAKTLTNMVRFMIVNLDRLEILQVLPPTMDRGVLADRERVGIELRGAQGVRRFEVGYLVEERLPAGPEVLRAEGGMPPVGLWDTATGKLLQVPGHLIVTLRNMQSGMTETGWPKNRGLPD